MQPHELLKLRGEQAAPASPRPSLQKPRCPWRRQQLWLQASLLKPTGLSGPGLLRLPDLRHGETFRRLRSPPESWSKLKPNERQIIPSAAGSKVS